MMNLRQLGRCALDIRNDNRKRPIHQDGKISYANWCAADPAEYWFTHFIRHYFDEKDLPQAIRFYSVFGPKNTVREPFDGVKIFYSGENLEEFTRYDAAPIREVSDVVWHVRKRKFDRYGFGETRLSMAFPAAEDLGRLEKGKTHYLRFPLWIAYVFDPESDREGIDRKIEEINRQANHVNCEGIACIASHDFYGTRQAICNELEQSGAAIQYAGKWRHNTDVLQEKFGDDKLAYLKSVRFNICPENTDTKNYVTEKLFDAFRTGVIPIYHGSGNDPEPGLINKDAVLFWDYNGNGQAANAAVISKIHELSADDRAYRDFMHQEKLTKACADYVWQCMGALREELEKIL